MNVIFMGTPDFAVPTLDYLVKSGYNIKCVVTQPDKPKGRGNRMSFSAVKEKALEYNIPVLQPLNIKKDAECIEKLKEYNPDVIVVVAFGQILPVDVLSIPHLGCINVHASLLPHLRGAAPINWSIINGDKETGITTMFMDKGLDTGDMLLKEAVEIEEDETAGSLHDRLMVLGAELLIKTLKCLERGDVERKPQDSTRSTYAPMLNKDTGKIIWSNKSLDIKNLVRGTNPYPGAYGFFNNARLKIWKVDIDNKAHSSGEPGVVSKVDKDGIHLYTGDGEIIVREVQPENGKRIDAYSYTLGHAVNAGDKFE
jgi:methionyl-tRNA formyltransferase